MCAGHNDGAQGTPGHLPIAAGLLAHRVHWAILLRLFSPVSEGSGELSLVANAGPRPGCTTCSILSGKVMPDMGSALFIPCSHLGQGICSVTMTRAGSNTIILIRVSIG